ncbi:MAG: hypothetical protein ABJF88_15710 [Rhodothermales bacterium]
MRPASALLALVLVAGCASDPAPRADADTPAETVALAAPSPNEVEVRVGEAQARLAESEAGRRVWASIVAHGGLARWYGNGPLHFRYRYERGGDEPAIDTEQTVDTWSSRARHTVMPDSSASFGWTGDTAWIQPAGADISTNARFWSLTPYYFVAMPFVLADPGVNLALDGQMTAEGETYDLVRVTFDAGTGDAPDDYYVLLLDPKTDRVGGVRYVVSYPGFFPEGGTTPERLMLYDGAQTVSGITLQEGFRSFAWTANGVGEPAAQGTVSGARFVPDAPDSLFAMPAGADVQEAM